MLSPWKGKAGDGQQRWEVLRFTRRAPLPRCLYFGLTEQLLPKISSCQLLCVTGNLKHSWVHDKDGTRVIKATHLSDNKNRKNDSQNTNPPSAQEQNEHRHCWCHLDTRDTGRMQMVASVQKGTYRLKAQISRSGQD